MSTQKILAPFRSHPDFLGVELTDVNQRGAFDDAPLHIACRRASVGDVEALLDARANINMPGDMGYTPLHYAALAGKPDIVAKLLSRGASITALNEFGETPRNVAEQMAPLGEDESPPSEAELVARAEVLGLLS